ncbi:hypothetical protein LJC11_05085 [Bacteroidales bacterium OttesenSCG-928-I21]|nr:hypothetical protein [Bacteroidales bacterium OttesenSCG-928-I21]
MNFDEKRAKEIVAKYNLNTSIVKVWKTRGKIPAKYFTNNPLPVPIESEAEFQLQRDIIRILQNGKINKISLSRLAEVKISKINDVLSSKSNFNNVELLSLKKSINKIKIDIRAIFEILNAIKFSIPQTAEKKIKSIFSRSELYFSKILPLKTYHKFDAWVDEKRCFPTEEIEVLKDSLSLFLIELSL